MSRILNLLFFFLGICFMFSQAEEGSILNLPQIVPVSPEAASLARYGDIPVNLSTGKINYTIPLYTIKAGRLELPLTLSYNYGGFMPEDEASMVGVGWTANFGGAIIRKLEGKADEKSNLGYLGLSNYYENFSSLSQQDQDLTIRNSGKGLWDSHPDGYVINTPLIDGTFRFKNGSTPIFTPYRNHKVSVLNYNTPGFNGFNITDDKGIIYSFDVPETTEQENLDGDADILEYRSSWMISNIDIPDSGENITFSYEDYYHVISSLSKYRTKKLTLGSGPVCGECQNSSIYQSENETRINAKALNRIDFPQGYILMTMSTIQKPGISGSQKKILRNLSVFNLQDQLIEKFNFNYFELEDYHFLTSIVKEGNDGSQIDHYSFDYYDLAQVPNTKILNDKTDMWGFYNDLSFDPNTITSQNSVFNKGRIGALKKITYPTKGYTDIEYEANSVIRSGDLYDSCNPIWDAPVEISIDSGDYPSQYCPGATSPIEQIITIPFKQVIKVTVRASSADAAGEAYASFSRLTTNTVTSPNYYCSTYESFPGAQTEINAIVLVEDEGDGTPVDQVQEVITKTVNVEPGTYKLYVEVCGNGGQSTTARVNVSYRSQVYQGVDENIEIGGIRVSNTIDHPNTTASSIIKNYEYTNEENSLLSSGILLANPKLSSSIILKQFTDGSSQCLQQTEYFSSVIPLATYSGSHILYKRVEIVGDTGENGKTVNYYTGIVDNPPPPYFPKLTSIGRGIKRGKLEKQEIYAKEGSSYSLKKKTENIYQDFQSNNGGQYVFDFFSAKYIYNFSPLFGCGATEASTGSLEYQSDFRAYYPDDYRIGSTVETLYLGNGTMSTQTDYLYDDIHGLNKEITTTNSDGNVVQTNYFYPKDVTGVGSLGLPDLSASEYSAIVSLKQQNTHKIGVPLRTKTSNNGEEQSQRSIFKDWGNGNVLPERIEASKGANVNTPRLNYHDYDDRGNPLTISKTDGTSISYIWGYGKQYPIAKIENASYADIASALGITVNALKNYDEDNMAAINGLRSGLGTALVTTYAYDSLIGVTSITDPSGLTTTYIYDSFNRLKEVRDANSDVVTDYDYHYKGQ